MKKFLYIILLTTCLSSCKGDEAEEVSIVGTWRGDRLDVRAGNGVLILHEETDEDFDGQLVFDADGQVIYTRDNVESPGNYVVDGQKLTMDPDLNIYNIDGPVTFDIVTLTAQRLQLRLNETRTVPVPDVGDVPITITATIDFVRL